MKPIFILTYILFTLFSCTSRGAEGVKDVTADTTATTPNTQAAIQQENDDIIRLMPFSLKDFQKEQNVKTAREIKLQKVGIEQLKKMTSLADYTWIVVWASWCPHCAEGLTKYPGYAEKVKSMENLNMILVTEDYNLPATQDRLFEIGYKKQAYVLDPEEFGMDEEVKITKMRQYLCPSCEKVEAVVPQHYLFNKNGQIILSEVGGDLTDIDIMTAIHSK